MKIKWPFAHCYLPAPLPDFSHIHEIQKAFQHKRVEALVNIVHVHPGEESIQVVNTMPAACADAGLARPALNKLQPNNNGLELSFVAGVHMRS